MSKSENRRVNIWINGKEVRNDVASIRKEMLKLQNQQSRMVRGSKEYVAAGKEIRKMKAILAQHRQDLNKTSRAWVSMKSASQKFNQYFGMITAGVATLSGMVFSFRKAADAANHFEERLDNLSALTGLVGRELEWLSDQSKELSVSMIDGQVRVKQSADDIIDAYTKVGSQRPELLKNKEALNDVTKNAIILSEAAKTQLEPATTALTTTMNQFNEGADQSRRIINSLAAGSKEGAADIPYLSQAMEKAGTTMNILGLEVEDGVAIIETVAPKFKEARMAGNSLDKVLLKMRENNIGFVNGAFDMNVAMDELKLRFANGETAAELFGVEHAKMVEVMVQGQDEFNRYLEAVTDTNVAIEQASINTSNNAAMLAQAKNKVHLLAIELGENLSPAMTKSLLGFGSFLKIMIKLPKFIKDNEILFIAITGAILALNQARIMSAALIIQEIALKGKAIALGKLELITVNARAIAARTMIMLTGKSTIAQKRAIVAQKGLNAAMKANPIGLIITGITALISVVKLYDKYNATSVRLEREKKEVVDQLKTSNDLLKQSYDSVTTNIGKLNTLSIQEKQDMRDKITLTLEQARANLLKAKSERTDVHSDNFRAGAWDYLSTGFNAIISSFGNEGRAATTFAMGIIDDMKDNADEAVTVIDDQIQQLEDFISTLEGDYSTLDDILNAEAYGDQIGTGTLTELESKLAKYQLALRNTLKDSEDYVRIQKKIADVNSKMKEFGSDGDDDLANKKAEHEAQLAKTIINIRRQLNYATMDEHQKELEMVNDKYHDLMLAAYENGNDTTELHRLWVQEIEQIEEEHQQEMSTIREKAEKKIQTALMSDNDKKLEEIRSYYEELIKLAKDAGLTEYVQELKEAMEDAMAPDDDNRDIFGMSPEEWETLYNNIQTAIQLAQGLADIWAASNERKKNLEDQELQDYEDNIDYRKELLERQLDQGLISQKKYNLSVASLDDQLDKKKTDVAREQAKREKNQRIFQANIQIAASILQALSSTDPPYSYILAAITGALGAIQLTAIKKEPLPAYGYGGYSEDKPHLAWLGDRGKKEWVASGEMVEDPVTGPIIEDLQRMQTGQSPRWLFSAPAMPDVDSYTTAAGSSAFYSSGARSSSGSSVTSTDPPVFSQMLSELRELKEDNRKLKDFMSDPNNRRAYISHELQKDYDDQLSELQRLSRTD